MIVACLAVRLKSKRLNKKALLKLSGKELFLHTYERASQAKKIDKVIEDIKKDRFSKATLGGCIIEKINQTVVISKE